ncbi:MAG: translation initiation factor IF-2 [Armatimonadetes bacterium]|nr:translation initiation factor IF-2 [Armatimonadota bacterium]
MSIRVSDLAKELGVTSSQLISALHDLGVEVAGPTSTIDEDTAELVRELLASQSAGVTEVPENVIVRDFADILGISPSDVQKALIEMGVLASLTQTIAFEQAEKVAAKLGKDIRKGTGRAPTPAKPKAKPKAAPKGARERPPVVTVLGHVDHGKTSLLDAIRNTRVTAGEFGGITQHIGAYQVIKNDKPITFIDTPGHAAFTAMRARGAQVTDIAVLVVAADDGIMPQTREAIDHARAAGVPIIVALNKIDRPDANPERVKQQLAEVELIPEEWGGDTMVVPVSATEGTGIDDLLERIQLQAEVLELTADPAADPEGVVIESRLERGRGPVATLLVQNGTLKIGASVVVGSTYGKVKAMIDDKGQRVQKAGPATPIELLGLQDVPNAGETLTAATDDRHARQAAQERTDREREERLASSAKVSLEDLYRKLREGEVKELNVVIKSDVDGSAEAIRQSLDELSTDEVAVKVIRSSVGNVAESDVMLAAASSAIVIGFNVRVEKEAIAAAERERVEVREYNIIYELLDDVRKAMAGLLEPEEKEEIIGHAQVRQLFKTPGGMVAGSYMQDGRITRNSLVRVMRDGKVVFSGGVDSLRRFKEDVREVVSGFECGIQVDGFNSIQENDIIEAYEIQQVARTL